ncbi:MAG: helix-turn-helix domain-containing protein [Selenomonadaceae bacterium]|nr:helix-turn-helix domain-containing protein [Selenomonadaceae bacterium]
MDKKNLNGEIGARIKQRRKELGYTREQAAELANISVQFLFDIEKGNKSMTAMTIVKLAEALFVSTDDILMGTGEDEDAYGVRIAKLLSPLLPEQKELAEEMLRLFVRGVSMSGKAKKI